MHGFTRGIGLGLFLGIFSLVQPFSASAETVKTYVKQYSIFTFDNRDYLCEPYQVQKNDWLYKIFRNKGEISADDFPKFLKIFRELNPRLSNIDAIEPGHQILIPLKEVSRKAYEEKSKNIVEVPVLEFSSSPKDEQLAAFIHPHIIRRGDTVSTLLDRSFREKGGAVSDTGRQLFQQLNPGINDLDKIYLGSRVLIPDPAILDQPWFNTFLAGAPPLPDLPPTLSGRQAPIALPSLPDLPPEDLVRLKRYAQLVQGTLQHRGKMVFPGKDSRPSQVLDLAKTPLLTEKNGQKRLILPPDSPGNVISGDLLKGIKAYWKELQIQELNNAISTRSPLFSTSKSLDEIPKTPLTLIGEALSATPFSLQPSSSIFVKVGTLDMEISLARIIHPKRPDILVNPGAVFGTALEAMKTKGYEVLTLSPRMTGNELLLLMFSKLGYTTWKDPAFNTRGRVTPLKGIYAVKQEEKLFLTRSALSGPATDFLTAEGITLIHLNGE